MTTYNGPTPYTEDLELFRRVAPATAARHILEGLETAYRRGWGDAKAEDAPLLKDISYAKELLDISERVISQHEQAIIALRDRRDALMEAAKAVVRWFCGYPEFVPNDAHHDWETERGPEQAIAQLKAAIAAYQGKE